MSNYYLQLFDCYHDVLFSQKMITTYALSKYGYRTNDTASSVVPCLTTCSEVRGSNTTTVLELSVLPM